MAYLIIGTSSFARFSYSECGLRSLRSLTHMGVMRQGVNVTDNIIYAKWLRARAAHNTGNQLWQCRNIHKNPLSIAPSLPPSLPSCPPAGLPACLLAGLPTDPPTYLYLQYLPTQFHRDLPMLYEIL